jgi:hypothetical protein
MLKSDSVRSVSRLSSALQRQGLNRLRISRSRNENLVKFGRGTIVGDSPAARHCVSLAVAAVLTDEVQAQIRCGSIGMSFGTGKWALNF